MDSVDRYDFKKVTETYFVGHPIPLIKNYSISLVHKTTDSRSYNLSNIFTHMQLV